MPAGWSVVEDALENAGFDWLGGYWRPVTWQVGLVRQLVDGFGGLGGIFIYEGSLCSSGCLGDLKCLLSVME